ncbi:uncharacterized protein cubi_01205 [Cryptosporidium ubiquitum]|uniref:Uncharacterized protein n=1 Tax=Cryptosporidium ubiquitum TaxID=857276 RepID=A0A1J4MJF6_9CRYT|nr:uncharacterized protein cubi_01205 [Cryptosporidium ubiquitum]OII74361.1 hypothetical protein cubi_01205 [Cryptosporidium ubiquitum]
MYGNYGVLEFNEYADRVTAYLYVDRDLSTQLSSYMEAANKLNCKNQCLETSIIFNNGNLWLVVRWVTEKKKSNLDSEGFVEEVFIEENSESNLEKPLCSDLKIVLKLPNRLQVKDVLSVSYYHENIVGMISKELKSNIQEITSTLFSRVVLSLKSKLSLLTISTLVTDLNWDQSGELPVIEEDESICLDFETSLLNRLATKNHETHEKLTNKLNLYCKRCNNLISGYSENWITAPLPTEMLIHGSEMLTCDNCCPLLSTESGNSSHCDFGARPNWICLGQYHISVNLSNACLDHLIIRHESGLEKTVETFFINDINNVYYYSQKAFHSIFCKYCGANLGWKNDKDNYLNFWKSKILLNVVSEERVVLSLFANYPIISLVIHYIEKYLKQYSKLYIIESNKREDGKNCKDNINKNKGLISLYIVKKNVIKLKTPLFIGKSYNEIESQTSFSSKRPVLYSSIKISYDLYTDGVIKNDEHQIHLEEEQFCYLVRIVQKNNMFNKNSYFGIPILSSDLV